MPTAHLRFSTEILKRFGEELNPHPDQGILELVKNAYDADAITCKVELISINEPGGIIKVTDDGDGMDEDDILNGWLILGSSSKSPNKVTKLGRRPAGNKGLGRLAALRMGTETSLVTCPKENPEGKYELIIDWTEFDNVKVVEDVPLTITSEKRSEGEKDGTVITLSKIKSKLNRLDVKRLARGLLLLADPFTDDPVGFQPTLEAPEFQDLEKLVQGRYFRDAEFHLTAVVNDQGTAYAIVTDFNGKTLFEADHAELRRKKAKESYKCPAATFDLWVFILNRESFAARQTTINEIKEWLDVFGGVHLYMRGLRVAPYGNPGNDWLDMNLQRVRHPEVRPSTNTAIGRITVADPKEDLTQKTDRSGIIEGESFQELKAFATEALAWMARRRLDERDRRLAAQKQEAPRKVEDAKASLRQAINVLALSTKSQKSVEEKFDQYDRAREKQVQTLRKEVQLYRTMSTAGITAAVFAHESKQPVSIIKRTAIGIDRRGKVKFNKPYMEYMEKPVIRIIRQAESLQTFGNLTLSFIDHDKRRASRVEIHDVITNVLNVFKPLVADRKVDLAAKLEDAKPYLRASQAAIESIITNLIVNSLRAFELMEPGHRTIEIRTRVEDDEVIIRGLDNGPGIEGISLRDIWLPGESTYSNGTGLGLTIVRDTVRDLGGEVGAVANGEIGGAEIVITLPILGA